MTDAELTARLRTNLAAFKALQCEAGVLRRWDRPGVRALAVPGRTDTLFQQQVLCADAGALAAALPELEAWYRACHVPAWRIPVAEGDTALASLLAAAGYRRGERVPHMGLVLPPHPPPLLPPRLTLERTARMDEVLALNALCYGPSSFTFLDSWRGAPPPSGPVHGVLLREEGRALACALSFEQGDTAGIYLVATHPEARRRGLGARVMQALHADVLTRGRTLAVLQATPQGQALYERLGYQHLTGWTDWLGPAPG